GCDFVLSYSTGARECFARNMGEDRARCRAGLSFKTALNKRSQRKEAFDWCKHSRLPTSDKYVKSKAGCDGCRYRCCHSSTHRRVSDRWTERSSTLPFISQRPLRPRLSRGLRGLHSGWLPPAFGFTSSRRCRPRR